MIPYIKISDLSKAIMENFHKIPKDIIGVVGIMRSGMIPATIIAERLNVGLATLDEFVSVGKDIFKRHGVRKLRDTNAGGKILVVDDTCFNGLSLKRTKTALSREKFSEYEFVYMVVYMEGTGLIEKPDLFLLNINSIWKQSDIKTVMYEWNIFANPALYGKVLFDMDGVLCVDPPDERNTEAYVNYIENRIEKSNKN